MAVNMVECKCVEKKQQSAIYFNNEQSRFFVPCRIDFYCLFDNQFKPFGFCLTRLAIDERTLGP